jgi:hypothetical protein
MIRITKRKLAMVTAALVVAGGAYVGGNSEALAHDRGRTVVVRPGDRVVYRGPVRQYTYPGPRFGGPPPWAASWYRSRHWRDNWQRDWKDDRRNSWREDRRDDWRDYWRRRDRRSDD